ncbi:TonB-dependent receptor [Aquimarina sp. 2201CG5-10]|nr:TonB-dependent receptor [Aquimarina sp. 2201CG5-10]MDY8136441.1 TonB-dependent receptor [Aquimarina sp. 2201CG5-10]
MEDIEKSYDVRFSFNAQNVENERISINETDILSNILQKIQSQTSLVFEKVNERYYVIRKKSKKGKVSICGYLIDDMTKEPLSGATVTNITKSNTTVTTDKVGYFEMFLSEPQDIISLRFLGYRTRDFKAKDLSSEECRKIFLSEDNFNLGEVHITEYVTSGTSRDSVTGAVHIDPSKLGILPRLVEPDVLQTLQFLPGIQSPNETASGLFIRGGTPDHNLVLWDGIKMYSSGHFFDLISIFNPYITEDVKLYRGGTEARYGSRVSGVIDIKSKNEIPDDFGAGFGFNLTNIDAFIETPITEDFGLIISGRRAFTDFLETTTYRSYSDRAFQTIRFFLDNEALSQEMTESENVFYFNDYTVKAIAKPTDSDKIVASTIFTNNKLDYTFNVLNVAGFNEVFDDRQNDNLEFVNRGLNLSWDKEWDDSFSHSIQAYFSNFDFDYEGERDVIADDGFVLFENDIVEKNSIRDVGFNIHTDWKIDNTSSIVSGYEFSTNKVLYTADYSAENFTFDDINHNVTHAVYGEYRANLGKKVNINVGLRVNSFSVIDDYFLEPRLNIDVKLHKNLKARLSAEVKNQVISQVSNYLPNDFNLDNQVWLLANPDFISNLSSRQFSGGFEFSKNQWYLDVDTYYKTTEGLTSFVNGFNGVLGFTEGKNDVFGVDVLLKKRIHDYRTWIGYSWGNQDFKFPEVNNGISFSGNFDITHYFSWVHSYQLDNFEFSLGWNIRTGRPFTPARGVRETTTAFFIDYERVNSERLDDYHRLDFSASYKFNFSKNQKWKGKIGFSLFNLYDRKNILNRIYAIRLDNSNPAGTKALLQEIDTFSSGITPNLSFRVNF